MVVDQMRDKEGEKEGIKESDEGTGGISVSKGGNGGGCGYEDGIDEGGPCYECGGRQGQGGRQIGQLV